jgi:hypothetical protein
MLAVLVGDLQLARHLLPLQIFFLRYRDLWEGPVQLTVLVRSSIPVLQNEKFHSKSVKPGLTLTVNGAG